MSLKDFSTTSTGPGTITDPQLFNTPIEGEVEGEAVMLIGFGNASHYSPANYCIGRGGVQAWVPLDKVIVTDRNYLPQQKTQLRTELSTK